MVVPLQHKFETGKWEPYNPLHCPGIYSMHTSKISEIMALLSPLYHCEILKMAKFRWSNEPFLGIMGGCKSQYVYPLMSSTKSKVFPSSCEPSQVRYRPLNSAGTLWSHLVVPLQPKFETGKWEPYRPPTLPWYLFDAHFKDKRDNGPPFTPISLSNAKNGKVQVS